MITNNVTVRIFTSSKRRLVKAVSSIMLSNKGLDVWTVGLKADFKCCFLIINYNLYTEPYSSHSVINVVCAAKAVFKYTLKYKKVCVLPIRMVKSNFSSVGRSLKRNSACWMRTIFLSIEIKSNTACALNCSRIKSGKDWLTAFQISLTSPSRPLSIEQNRRITCHLVQSRNFDKSSPIYNF